MPRHKGRHRKPRPPIVPTAALATTGAAAVVVTALGGGSQAGFVDAHTIPSTLDPTPTSAATVPDGLADQAGDRDPTTRTSRRVAQAADVRDASTSPASASDRGTSDVGSGSAGNQRSQPPSDEPSAPLPDDSPLPTASPSPTEDGPLSKLPKLPLPDTPDLPDVDVQVGTG